MVCDSPSYTGIRQSKKFGSVCVVRAKLPIFPEPYTGVETIADGQDKHSSVVTLASVLSGELWGGVFVMIVPWGKDGYSTIVLSRPEDRPEDMIHENGVA